MSVIKANDYPNYILFYLESIFKSIDPWILGLCRSYCHKHGWKYNTTSKFRKKSIFSSGYNLNGVILKRSKSCSTRNVEAKKKLKRKKRKKSKKPLISLNYSENPSQLSLQSAASLDSNALENSRNQNNLSMIRLIGESSSDSSASSNVSECEDVDAEAETEEYTRLDSDSYYLPPNNNSNNISNMNNNKNYKERFGRSDSDLNDTSKLKESLKYSPLANVFNNQQNKNINNGCDKNLVLQRFKSLNLD
jgi:hypothetical protein